MFCKCGRQYETSAITSAQLTYDGNGELIYEVCQHGQVVVDKRPWTKEMSEEKSRQADKWERRGRKEGWI